MVLPRQLSLLCTFRRCVVLLYPGVYGWQVAASLTENEWV